MRPELPEMKGGPVAWKNAYNRLRKFVLDAYMLASEDIDIADAPGGRQIILRRSSSAGGGSAVAATTPLEVLPVDGTHVRVRYGTINSIVPDGMSFGDDPVYTLTVSPPCVVYALLSVAFDADTSIWSVTDVSIATDSLLPDATDATARISLGSVASGGGVANEKRGSLQWERDGDDTNYADTFR